MKTVLYLLSKIMFFLMVLTAPAMIAGNSKTANFDPSGSFHPANPSYFSSVVIKRFMKFKPAAAPIYSKEMHGVPELSYAVKTSPVSGETESMFPKSETAVLGVKSGIVETKSAALGTKFMSLEVRRVIRQATTLYDSMHLAYTGLNEEAFEYAWRGYHNLLKRGALHKTQILSICDFSQSSKMKRMYVIDVQHKKLLFRTYVAHGQNSGAEYASTFSNLPESGMSSLGFYVTGKTYYGRNGLSLKIKGVEKGYNDQALKRNIVLHGSAYICGQYLRNYGAMGTSLGCPAMPAPVSPKIIKVVKNGSCLFIFHPTKKYLSESKVING